MKVLNGWKEISNFLGVNWETAYRWSKIGMPVLRGPGRSRLAFEEMLIEWLIIYDKKVRRMRIKDKRKIPRRVKDAINKTSPPRKQRQV